MATSKPDFLETLFRLYAGEVHSFARRRVGTQDAEDLMQDAYVRLLQHPDPASIDNPRAFLYQVSANLATDRDRAHAVRARHHTATNGLEQVPSTAPGPDALTAHHERLRRIASAMAQLPETCRTAFVLCRIEGYSYADAAWRLGISESMVAKHLDRAMRHCRDALAEA
ncbi:MAG: RNA polymerase sigma factor [Gammaproteobacteria bacterium]